MSRRSWVDWVRELRARSGDEGGGGMSEMVEVMSGRMESMSEGSGGGASGEKMCDVRVVTVRVWCVRWVVRAVWAVVRLKIFPWRQHTAT